MRRRETRLLRWSEHDAAKLPIGVPNGPVPPQLIVSAARVRLRRSLMLGLQLSVDVM
jgi:hypothetical protein